MVAELEESQAGEGRHKCACCAYAIGKHDGIREMRQLLEQLLAQTR